MEVRDRRHLRVPPLRAVPIAVERRRRGGLCNRVSHRRYYTAMRNLILSALFVLISLASSARGDFAIRDGDTVVFLGDSITAARTYGKIIENYTLLRFPERT